MKLLDPDQNYSLPQPRSTEEALLFQIYDAASKWYTTKNPEHVKQYHDLYHQLRSRGWNGIIDVDAELPDNLMPQDYLNQVATAQHSETLTRPSITVTLTLDEDIDNQEVMKVLRERLNGVGVKEVRLTKTSA